MSAVLPALWNIHNELPPGLDPLRSLAALLRTLQEAEAGLAARVAATRTAAAGSEVFHWDQERRAAFHSGAIGNSWL